MVNSRSTKSADLWPLWGWWWWQAKRTLANSCPNDIDEFMEDVIRSISESDDRRRRCAPVTRHLEMLFVYKHVALVIRSSITKGFSKKWENPKAAILRASDGRRDPV